jgi:hypothetical protein
MIPNLDRPETLVMDGEAQLEAVREAVLPSMTSAGIAHLCRVDLWRNHPGVIEALEQGDYLVLAWPDGSLTLTYGMSEAILSAIPTPKAQEGAQYFRHLRTRLGQGNA